jgi:hypothetical protein
MDASLIIFNAELDREIKKGVFFLAKKKRIQLVVHTEFA